MDKLLLILAIVLYVAVTVKMLVPFDLAATAPVEAHSYNRFN